MPAIHLRIYNEKKNKKTIHHKKYQNTLIYYSSVINKLTLILSTLFDFAQNVYNVIAEWILLFT